MKGSKVLLAMLGLMAALPAGAGTLDLSVGESQWFGNTLVRCGGAQEAQPRSYCECRPDEAYNRAVNIPNYAYKLFKVTEYADGRRNEVLLVNTSYIGGELCERTLRSNPSCQ